MYKNNWFIYYRILLFNIKISYYNISTLIFENEIRFNNKGYWVKNENKDKSIITTQLFFQHIVNNNFKLFFDSLNVFTKVIRY